MLRLLSLLFVVALCASILQGQTIVTIGTATTGNAFPFNASTGMRYQQIYAAGEIGLAAGATLTEIQVAKVGGTIATYNNFRLRLAHTTIGISSTTTTYDTNYQGALSVVMGDPNVPGTAPVNLLPTSIMVGTQEYVRFPFTTNFAYNGTGNLLLDWSYNTLTGAGWSTSGGGRHRVYLLGGNAQSVTANGTGDGANWQVRLIFNTGPAPEMDVSRGATAVADGATDSIGTTFSAGTAAPLTYTIANTGTLALTLTNPATIGALNNCTASITTAPAASVAAASNTSTVLSVTPTTPGAFSFTYSIANNDGNENPYNWTISGSVPIPLPEMDVSRAATAIADGATDTVTGFTAGTAGALTYTIDNTGPGSLTLTNPATIGALTNCAVTITTAPGTPVASAASTTTILSVTPTAAGTFSFTYSIGNNDANENPYNWIVSGTAAAAAVPEMDVTRGVTAIADGSTDAVGAAFVAAAASTLTYTFTNSGTASLTVTNPATIGALVNCTVTITVAPTSPVTVAGTTSTDISVTPTAAGAFSFTYSIANNDANENPYDWTVSGTATAPAPEMDLTRGAAAVADAGTDAVTGGAAATALVLTYTITNAGSANLTLTLPVAAPGALTNCTATISTPPTSPIAAAGTSIFAVTVTPTAAGAFSCTVSIGNNDANENPYNWTISGTATGPTPEMDVLRAATAINDGGNDAQGNVLFGVARTATYTITNTGTAGLNLTGAPTLVVAAAVANITSATVTTQPAASVAMAASTTFVVTYNVTAVGAFSFTLSIANNDSNENPYNWTVDGTGVAMPEIHVTRSAAAVTDGGTNAIGNQVAGQSQVLTYTIANQGNQPLTITTPVTIAGQTNCTVTVTTEPNTSVAAAGTTTLVISVSPTAVGAFSFTVSITNNDADENPYNWTASGTGTTLGGGVSGGGGGGGSCAAVSANNASLWVMLSLSVMAAVVRLRRQRA